MKNLLLAIDLEDVRQMVQNGDQYEDRLVANTKRFLDFFKERDLTITFFSMGKVAEKYPGLIKEIHEHGHEIGLHSYSHVPIPSQTRDQFEEDLKKNIDLIQDIVGKKPIGYRAPANSMTPDTEWVYDILDKFEIKYSSSILPSSNPLYSWRLEKNYDVVTNQFPIPELPMSISNFIGKEIPPAGGVFFRLLPGFILNWLFQKHDAVVGYLHPYDIDTDQEFFRHYLLEDKPLLNLLMYIGRGTVFRKLDYLIKKGWKPIRYDEYLQLKF